MTDSRKSSHDTVGLRDLLRDAALAPLLSERVTLCNMLRFEAALAQAEVGLLPPAAAAIIGEVCHGLIERLQHGDDLAATKMDVHSIGKRARRASTLAIPFVQDLTACVAAQNSDAAKFVHFGATSQDVVETATILQIREAAAWIDQGLTRCGNFLAALAKRHSTTPMLGRTLLQAATPISFGWKAACWLDQLSRVRSGSRQALEQLCVLQFGGAGGTLATLGDQAQTIAEKLAALLELRRPAISWHSSRDRWARYGGELGITTGAIAKIGYDIALLMQPEIGELAEPHAAGRGASSAMTHKRNPVGAMLMVEASHRANALASALLSQMQSELERGLGQWQGTHFILVDLLEATGSAMQALQEVLANLELHPEIMQRNLDRHRSEFDISPALAGAEQMINVVLANWTAN